MTDQQKLEALKKSFATEDKVYKKYLKAYEKAKVQFEQQKKFVNTLAGKISDLKYQLERAAK